MHAGSRTRRAFGEPTVITTEWISKLLGAVYPEIGGISTGRDGRSRADAWGELKVVVPGAEAEDLGAQLSVAERCHRHSRHYAVLRYLGGAPPPKASLLLSTLDRYMDPNGRVLVVDDEPAIRALVMKIVERAGHPVDSARDGAEAIIRLDQERYAVVVLDLMMPNIDGYGLIEHLKSRGGPRPAIIVVSAGDTAALRRLDGSMVHSILRKPFDIDVLGDLISAAVRSMEEVEEAAAPRKGQVLPFPKNDSVC